MNRLLAARSRLVHTGLLLALAATLLFSPGCAHQRYVTLRKAPRNPLKGPLNLDSGSGPKPTDRTELLLRRYDLAKTQEQSPGVALAQLREEIVNEPSPDKIYSYAELAYIDGKRKQDEGKIKEALDLYGASV